MLLDFFIFKDIQIPFFLSSLFVQPNPNGYNTACICKAYSTAVVVINADVKYCRLFLTVK